jgi:hypothetical protein
MERLLSNSSNDADSGLFQRNQTFSALTHKFPSKSTFPRRFPHYRRTSPIASSRFRITQRFDRAKFLNSVHIALQGIPRSILAEYADSHL